MLSDIIYISILFGRGVLNKLARKIYCVVNPSRYKHVQFIFIFMQNHFAHSHRFEYDSQRIVEWYTMVNLVKTTHMLTMFLRTNETNCMAKNI